MNMFIEVEEDTGDMKLLNVMHIISITDEGNSVSIEFPDECIDVEMTFEEIKNLIKGRNND